MSIYSTEKTFCWKIFTWSSQNLARLSKKLSFTLVLAWINKGTAFNCEQFGKKRIVMGGTHGCHNLCIWVNKWNSDLYHEIQLPLTFLDGTGYIREHDRRFFMLFWGNLSLLLRVMRNGFLEKKTNNLVITSSSFRRCTLGVNLKLSTSTENGGCHS